MTGRLRNALTVVLLACGGLARAEEGSISGAVKDTTGGALPGTAVTAVGPVTRSSIAGSDGRYTIAPLPAGTYVLTARHLGFSSATQAGVALSPGQSAEIPFTLSVGVSEAVVVSASRSETDRVDAPATMSVISSDAIEASPAQNYGDLLRSVPGLNVVQTSAREVNLATRQVSPTLTNSQLALVDGRTIYSDFFNIVFWDLIPTETEDIKQIEVVRGPASAIWGANAASGVVNIITKSPREAQGTSLTLTGGGFSRDAGDTSGEGPGSVFGANLDLARAPNDTWSYRLSAGYTDADAFPRPTGQIPLAQSPEDPNLIVGGGSYGDTAYANRGTKQPKIDVRVDEVLGDSNLSYSAGFAESQGIIQTPIGPFDMENGSHLGYGRVSFTKGALHVSTFANFLDGNAPSLLTRDAFGNQILIDFKNNTFDLDAGDSRALGRNNVLSYGANLRENTFNISIAPGAPSRTEAGAYVQDELVLGKFQVDGSARVDKLGNLDQAFVSPRLMIAFKPTSSQSLRATFNRAFHAPSAIDNYINIKLIGDVLPLGLLDPSFGNQTVPIVTSTIGNANLKAESIKAYELAYTGVVAHRTTIDVAAYLNDSDNVISQAASAQSAALLGFNPFYSSTNPPPGWPLPPQVLDVLAAQGILLPEVVQSVNLGKLRNKGLELGVDHTFSKWLSAYANYSYQASPESLTPLGDPRHIPADAMSVPPKNRVNAGITLNHSRFVGSVSANYADKAFWADVLSDPFYGYSKAYTLLSASFGVHWTPHVTTTVKCTNLTNADIQQHIFGDILKRTVLAQIKLDL